MTKEAQALGEKIRAARKELKMTQAELAGSDFTKSFISQVEKGFARPSLKSLQILASRLNKPVSFFLGEDEAPATETPSSPRGEQLLETARALARQGHLQDAFDIHNEILASTPKSDRLLRARTYTEMSRVLWQLDRKLEAVEALEEGLELYRAGLDPSARARELSRLADYTAELGDYPRAVSLCEQALTVLDEADLDNPTLELKLRTDAGLYLSRMNQFQRARRHLKEAMRLAAETDDYYRWGEVCHAMGVILGSEGNAEEAFAYSMRAVHFYDAVADVRRKISARLNAASFAHQLGWSERARALLDEAEQEAQRSGERADLAQVNRLRGEIALDQGNWDVAEACFRAALRNDSDPESRPLLLHRLARALKEKGNLEEAINCARQAVHLLEKRKGTSREALAQAYSDLARLLQAAGAHEEAQSLLLRSLDLFR